MLVSHFLFLLVGMCLGVIFGYAFRAGRMARKKKPPIGVVFRVKNKDRKFGADPNYLALWVRLGDAEPVFLLLTSEDFMRLSSRGRKNPEDQPEGIGPVA